MKKITEEIKAGIALSFATCFMVFLYSPLETYFTNVQEFWFDFSILFPPMLLTFVLLLGISVFSLYVLKRKFMRVYNIIILAGLDVFICTYVQGNFFANSLPILNGQWIEWNDYPEERIKCIILWIVVVGITIFLSKFIKMSQWYKVIKVISVCMTLMFLITLATLAFTKDGLKRKANVSVTTDELFTMSEDTNYIVFCLDAVSAYDFNVISEKHPEWQDYFEDFSFYTNVFGVYPCTRYTVPYFFGGELYEGQESYKDWQLKSYLDSNLLSKFRENDYKVGIYIADEMLPKDERMVQFSNIIDNAYGVNDYWDFIRWNIQISGFKYAPFDLKRICFVDPGAFNGLKLLPDGYESYTGKDDDVYELIKSESIEKTDDKIFKYIHIDGAHPPFRFDENVDKKDNATYESSIEASITITKAYLDKLKENDVYDNSVIIVLSDHGWDTGENEDHILRQQTPILFVKGIGEKHELRISEAPISYVDMQGAFDKLFIGNLSDNVFEWEAGDERRRRLLWITGEEKEGEDIFEFIQTGKSWDPNTVIKNKVEISVWDN